MGNGHWTCRYCLLNLQTPELAVGLTPAKVGKMLDFMEEKNVKH